MKCISEETDPICIPLKSGKKKCISEGADPISILLKSGRRSAYQKASI